MSSRIAWSRLLVFDQILEIYLLENGFVFNDLLANFERVADHSSNLAIATIELCSDRYDTHEYVINLKELHSHRFDEYYEEYAQKYSV